MTQPPNPPPSGTNPGGEQSGSGNSDDPTHQFDKPSAEEGQRHSTDKFPIPGEPAEGRSDVTRQIQLPPLSSLGPQGQQPHQRAPECH